MQGFVLRLDLGLKLRVFKMSSKCRDIGDVHQGIVCMLLNAISEERFLDQVMSSQGYLSAKRDIEPSGELKILHIVDDVYRDMRYCNKDATHGDVPRRFRCAITKSLKSDIRC